MKTRLAAAALLLLAAPALAAPPAPIARVAEAWRHDTAGVRAYMAETETVTDLGWGKKLPARSVTVTRTWTVTTDGVPTAVKVVGGTRDGKPMPAAMLRQAQTRAQAGLAGQARLAMPYDPKHVGAYAFTPGAANGTWAFKPVRLGPGLGSGTLTLNEAGRPVTITFAPAVPPPGARDVKAQLAGGPADDGGWAMLRNVTTFVADAGGFKGVPMKVTITQRMHSRFPTAAAALAAAPRR